MHPNFVREKYLIDYLDRYYRICNNYFYHKDYDKILYGYTILEELETVFSFGYILNECVLNIWAVSNGLKEEFFEKAYKNPWVEVGVGSRRIRAEWNPDLAQELSMFHSIDAEAELTNLLNDEIAREIDRDIMLRLRNNPTIHFGDLGFFNPAV